MRRYLLATAACLAMGGLPATTRAQTVNVDVEMAILIDASTSMTPGQHVGRMLDAHMRLFNDPRLMPFLRQQGVRSLGVAAYTFSTTGTSGNQRSRVVQLTDWQNIQSDQPP